MSTMTEAQRKEYREELNKKFAKVFPNGIPADEWKYTEGTSMATPIDTHEFKEAIVNYLRNDVLIDGINVPRFGLLSMKSKSAPTFVYGADCKPFMDISTTGFSDGKNIFISSLWMRRLMQDELDNERESGVLPHIMHHIMHLMRGHTRRLTMYETEIAEAAKDMSINLDLQNSFAVKFEGRPDMESNGMVFSKTLRELEPGFKPGDIKYLNLAEETIARMLKSESEKNKLSQQAKNGQGQPQPGQGQPGQGQPGQGQPGGKGGKGKDKNGKPESSSGAGDGDSPWDQIHNLPVEDFAKVLEDNPELSRIKDALGIPDSNDLEAIGKMEDERKLKDLSDIQKAMAQKNSLGGKYPGGHIVDAESERVRADTQGKLSYKLGMRDFIVGSGNSYEECWDVPGILAHVSPEDMGLADGEEIYFPETIPAKPDAVGLVILDTSGSMHGQYMKECLTEILWLKKNNGSGDTASEIFVYSADTCLRGEPEEINDENVEEVLEKGVNVFGRGGTDFATPLRQLLGSKIMKDKKPAFVLYFTDLCAEIPKKSDFPSNLPIAFICAPTDYNLEFAKGVKEWASVYSMEEGVEVDLTAEGHKEGPIDKRPGKKR